MYRWRVVWKTRNQQTRGCQFDREVWGDCRPLCRASQQSACLVFFFEASIEGVSPSRKAQRRGLESGPIAGTAGKLVCMGASSGWVAIALPLGPLHWALCAEAKNRAQGGRLASFTCRVAAL